MVMPFLFLLFEKKNYLELGPLHKCSTGHFDFLYSGVTQSFALSAENQYLPVNRCRCAYPVCIAFTKWSNKCSTCTLTITKSCFLCLLLIGKGKLKIITAQNRQLKLVNKHHMTCSCLFIGFVYSEAVVLPG